MKNTITVSVPPTDKIEFYSSVFTSAIASGLAADVADGRARLSVELYEAFVSDTAKVAHMKAFRGQLDGMANHMLRAHHLTDVATCDIASLRWFNTGTEDEPNTRLFLKFNGWLHDEEIDAVLDFIRNRFEVYPQDLTSSTDPFGEEKTCFFYFDIPEAIGQPFDGDFDLILKAA